MPIVRVKYTETVIRTKFVAVKTDNLEGLTPSKIEKDLREGIMREIREDGFDTVDVLDTSYELDK